MAEKKARQIAIYGKGSIGKSTISCNLSAALADMGLNIDLVFWDERLTTEQADETMAELGHTLQDRQRRIDAVAAAVILQSYLDSQERNQVFDKNPVSQA